MATQDYAPGHDVPGRVARTLGSLPIFPLPDIVLLPGAMLPLHVFEQRYRDLTAAVLASSGVMAMATLIAGDQDEPYEGRPRIHPTIGIGEVVAHEKLDSGRYNILLRGISRARILREHPADKSYRTVHAELVPDVIHDPDVIAANAQTLIAMCDRLSGVLPAGGERLRALARVDKNPSTLVDLVGAALIGDPGTRRALLEDADVGRRYDRVVEEIASLISQLAPASTSN